VKRTQRRHLKENEVELFVNQVRDFVEQNRRAVTAVLAVAVVIGAVALVYYAWRSRTESRAHELLADAMNIQSAPVVPPTAGQTPQPGTYPNERARAEAALAKYKAVVEAYPSTDAGVYARYQEAAALMTLGRPAEAMSAYDDVIQRTDANSIYREMAQLGVAEAQARTGKFDQAINTFKDLAQHADGPLPIDAILMQLGRTYVDAGKTADARQTLSKLLQEFPDSPYSGEAQQLLDSLKS